MVSGNLKSENQDSFPDKGWWHCYDCGYDWDFS